MTALELYEYALIEVNKLEAPSMLLSDYNYFINKAIHQYVNINYAKLEIDQQAVDDLRVLKTTAIYNLIDESMSGKDSIRITLPDDYVHLISCNIEYENSGNSKCNPSLSSESYSAKRISSDMYSQIISNAYLKPTYKRPYYTISNINSQPELPTHDYMDKEIMEDDNSHTNRKANRSSVNLEIKLGKVPSNIEPITVYVDYIKSPMYIELTQDNIDSGVSQVLEFPDYVCYEIVNIFTRLIMENASDPRLQTTMGINQTIPQSQLM